MFTGLVQHLGRVAAREPTSFGARFSVSVGAWPVRDPGSMTPPLTLGESIAVHGCCLTLARIDGLAADRVLGFDVIHQTLRVTALGRLAPGDGVHLERSATPSTLLGGHLVQGHVDGLGVVDAVLRDGGEWRIRIRLPEDLRRYVHSKSSIAIDGVSLTVADLDDTRGTVDVCLIPETLERTTLGRLVAGGEVHVEADCVAKMIARLARFSAS